MSKFSCTYCGTTRHSENGTGSDVSCCGEVGHVEPVEEEADDETMLRPNIFDDIEKACARIQHVVPVGDLREHETTMNCWCKPRRLWNGIVVHNSMDERESYENGRKLQ